VELKRRDDDSITGRITVIGSAVVQEARIEIIGSLRDRVIGPLEEGRAVGAGGGHAHGEGSHRRDGRGCRRRFPPPALLPG
jgi:hypothetical protein